MGLPVFDAEWFGLTGPEGTAEKIRRFNAAGTTLEELRSVADEGTISWMLDNGYNPPAAQQPTYTEPAPSDPIADLASELGLPKFIVANYINAGYSTDEVRNIFAPPPPPPEPPAPPEPPPQPPPQPPPGPTAEEIAAQQKAAADSQQRSKYGMTTDEFRSRLMAGSPSDLLVDQRLLEITLEKGWTPQLAVEIVNTTFGTNKTVSDYTTAMSKVLQDPITKLVQNGSTASEVAAIGKQIGIDDATLNAAISTAINTKAAEDIVKGVTALVPAGQSLGYDAIVKYADDNKLAYADVANALKSTFKDTTSEQIVNSMVYEKDRQQIDSIAKDVTVDGKTSRSVALPDAIALAISKGIETDNLAKFFGKTPAEFKTMVSDNLGSIASAVNKAGVDASIGLSDLLGISKDTTNAAVRRNDLQTGINSLAVTKDGKSSIPLDKAFEFAATNKLGDEELGSLIGMSVADITKARDTIATTGKLNDLKANDGKLTLNEILGVVGEKQMSIEDFVKNYFGNDQQTLTNLKAEAAFSPQERAWRETTPFDGTKIDQIAAFQDTNKLSDADMQRVFGVAPKDLDTYRVTSAMNQYAGEDKQLSYSELAKFAEDNKMDLSKVVSYLGTDETRPDILKGLEAYVADSKLTPQDRLTTQLNQITKEGTASGTWDKNSGWDHHLEKMVNYLTGYGITDLNQIGTRQEVRGTPGTGDEDVREQAGFTAIEGEPARSYTVYFDKVTGKELQAVPTNVNGGMWRFGSEGEGSGSTGYFLGDAGNGNAGITSNWEEKYGAREYALPLAIISAVAMPYLLPELIGTSVAGVELAALGGEMAAGTGLTGTLMSAGLPASVAQATATAIVRGTYNGLVSEAAGGDFSKGFISGGVAPVLGQMATNYAYYNLPDEIFSNKDSILVSRAIGNAVTQLVTNGELDLTKMAAASVTPFVVGEVVKASDGTLTSAQAKLLVDTVLSGGQNITAMASNPLAVLSFVQNNSKLFDEIASTGSSKSNINLTGLTDDQQGSLVASSDPNTPLSQVAMNDAGQLVVSGSGEDTAMAATGTDTINQSTSGTPTATTTVTAPSISSPIGDQLKIDTLTPTGIASGTTVATQPVTVTAPSEGVIDEALKLDTLLPDTTTVKTEPVTVTSTKLGDSTATKVDQVAPGDTTTSGQPSVTVTSTGLPLDAPELDVDDLIPDFKVDPQAPIPGSVNAGTVTVSSTPIITPTELVTDTLPPSSVTTGTPTVTTTPPVSTTTTTVPPIIFTPDVSIPLTKPTTTSTTTSATTNYDQPYVAPPELPTYYGMPYPNYLRPLDPYLPMGLAALMESYYAQEPWYGNYQSLQNAGPEIKIPT